MCNVSELGAGADRRRRKNELVVRVGQGRDVKDGPPGDVLLQLPAHPTPRRPPPPPRSSAPRASGPTNEPHDHGPSPRASRRPMRRAPTLAPRRSAVLKLVHMLYISPRRRHRRAATTYSGGSRTTTNSSSPSPESQGVGAPGPSIAAVSAASTRSSWSVESFADDATTFPVARSRSKYRIWPSRKARTRSTAPSTSLTSGTTRISSGGVA